MARRVLGVAAATGAAVTLALVLHSKWKQRRPANSLKASPNTPIKLVCFDLAGTTVNDEVAGLPLVSVAFIEVNLETAFFRLSGSYIVH